MPVLSAFARLAGMAAPLTRGMTLGVRGACIDADGRIFLVRHSYTPGWYMPGGGVERGESALDALQRELHEEAGIVIGEPPRLFGFYWNTKRRRDHIALYLCRGFSRPHPPRYPNREIAEGDFFDPSVPPEGTTPATQRRLAEILGQAPPDHAW